MNRDEFITNLILLGFVEAYGNIPRSPHLLKYTHKKLMLHLRIDKQHNTVKLWDISTLMMIDAALKNGLPNNYQVALKALVPYMSKDDE